MSALPWATVMGMTNNKNIQVPGTGAYAGLVWNGRKWTAEAPDGTLVPVTPITQAQPAGDRSLGRTLIGIFALVIAAIAALQGWSWFSGFADLDADGNQFAGILALLGMGAMAVAAGFGITGVVLLTKKR